MKRAVSLLSALSLAVIGSVSVAQQPPAKGQDMQAAIRGAEEALRTFAQIVNSKNYKAMGFDNAEQVRSATLGPPLEDFLVRLDELKQYQRGQDPEGLFHGTGRVTFPVLVQQRMRSSIVVSLQAGRWVPVSFGAPTYGRALGELRARLAQEQGRPASEFFEVRVPALNVTFIGRREGRLLLTPVLEDARFGFKAGLTMPADEALGAMVPVARDHSGLPT